MSGYKGLVLGIFVGAFGCISTADAKDPHPELCDLQKLFLQEIDYLKFPDDTLRLQVLGALERRRKFDRDELAFPQEFRVEIFLTGGYWLAWSDLRLISSLEDLGIRLINTHGTRGPLRYFVGTAEALGKASLLSEIARIEPHS